MILLFSCLKYSVIFNRNILPSEKSLAEQEAMICLEYAAYAVKVRLRATT